MKSRQWLGKIMAFAVASLALFPTLAFAQDDSFVLDSSGFISLDSPNSTSAVKPKISSRPAPAPATDSDGALGGVVSLDLLGGGATATLPAATLPPPPKPNDQTEASFTTECTTCHPEVAVHHPSLTKLPINKIAGLDDHPDRGNYHSAAEKCYSQALLRAAKRWAPHRDHSVGRCARGVRSFLNHAGIYGDYNDGLGDAIDYHVYGKLKALGFKNFIDQYPTPYVAPAGAILVFAGPYLSDYLRNGKRHVSRRGGRILGDWLGHITVKGDDGLYYTDGRTREPAIGWPYNKKRRRLVGVYLMQRCTGSCSQHLRNQCGGL